ncbi:MAG: hypothetical protein FRX49_09559 [Trebouxia sp. A1-2]|nr:MAG: hypothetical protein FRX49_09559 [Trebouxia sp. A1-2]
MVPAASLHPQIAPDVAVLPEGSAAVVQLSPGVPESLGLNMAISSNRTAASTQAANTVDDSHCGVPSCGQSCSDYTTSNAAALHDQNYLWFGTSSTCFTSAGAVNPLVVTVSQTLAGYTVATFSASVRQDFVNTLSTELAKMYGSVLVQVASISSGSVVVGTSVSFLDSVSGGSDAAAYEQLLSSSSAHNIYGTYAAAVDVSTIKSSRTSTPSTPSTGSSTSDATKPCNAAMKHGIIVVLACAIILF